MTEGIGQKQTPFELKRLGKLDRALEGYALEFAAAVDKNNKFLAEVSFDQMLDIVLMRYLRELLSPQKEHTGAQVSPVRKGLRFSNRQTLIIHAQRDLEELLARIHPSSEIDISKQMERCKPMLFPRGGGKVRFSVDPDRLINLEEELWRQRFESIN